jgi:hypothetical protein
MNLYGLDSRYFKEKLGQLVRDADNYTPQEMSLALDRLKRVADDVAVNTTINELPDAEDKKSDVSDNNQPIVMCCVNDAFGFFATALIDEYEHLFSGGEVEIANISHKFQTAFEDRLNKNGVYHSDDVIHRLQFENGMPITYRGT